MRKRNAMKTAILAFVFTFFIGADVQAYETAAFVPNMMLTSVLAQQTFRNTLPSIAEYSQTARAATSLASSSSSPGGKWRMWGSPFRVSESKKRDADYYGYDVTLTGFGTGLSRLIGQNSAIGFAVGYNSGKTSDGVGDQWRGRSDSVHAALYGGTAIGNLFLDVYAGYSRDSNRLVMWSYIDSVPRTYTTAVGKFHDNVRSTGFKASYVWLLPNEIRIVPALGLDYSHLRRDNFTVSVTMDSGPGGTIKVPGSHYTSVRMPISVAVNRTFAPAFLAFKGHQTLLTFEVRGAWIPQYGQRQASIRPEQTSAPTTSHPVNNSTSSVGAGLKIKMADRFVLGLDYDFVFAKKYRRNTFIGTLSVSF